MANLSCTVCRFFHPALTTIEGYANRKNDGECRRRSPRSDPPEGERYGWRIFPAVYAEDWCGDFQRIGPGETRGPVEKRG